MSIASKAASVTFDAVTKAFGPVVAVDQVSFRVGAGSLVTLLGPSGCGKTTTLRMIAGLEMATEGRILIGDQDVTSLPATDRDVSMVFQSYALFPHMTVIENVSYGLRVSGLPKSAASEQAHDGLALVGLKGYGDRLPSELSGGQQQRVAVARALVLEPQVLLFDEPLSNLDAKLRRRVREEIRDIQQNLGLTSVYVTHDQEEALAVSDRIIVMNNARIAQEGSPRELYEEPADLFVADFIGDANLVDAEILSVEDAVASVLIGDLELSLPSRGLSKGPARVAIRPQAISLSESATGGGMQGIVRKSSYLGSHIEYTIETAIGELFVIDGRVAQAIAQDSDVSVELSQQGVTLVRSTESAL
ncbi:ABC transporter ATP-binding protein [Pelagibius sp. Alg239-R121]|uniref:ABC transporter ATP-binding protein n=1 Tax=Pelagibius sp. Alg239-R121 TaxID=2993448 RepID=UPI0024A65581|nr:ABC transporter ATP-binding protein [Pelagibius sp. Alg239-R121]